MKLLYTQDAQNQYHRHTFIVHGKTRPHPRPPYSRYRSTIKGGRLLMTYASAMALHIGCTCINVSLVPRPLPCFQCCNIENVGVAWGRGYINVITARSNLVASSAQIARYACVHLVKVVKTYCSSLRYKERSNYTNFTVLVIFSLSPSPLYLSFSPPF